MPDYYSTEFNKDDSFAIPSQSSFSPIASPLVASVSNHVTENPNEVPLSPPPLYFSNDYHPNYTDVQKANDPEFNSSGTAASVLNDLTLSPVMTSDRPETNQRSKFKMEELMEENEDLLDMVSGLVPVNGNTKSPIDSIGLSFEYYDFSAEKENVHVPPTLSARSLVSPVPYPRPATTHKIITSTATPIMDVTEPYIGETTNVVQTTEGVPTKRKETLDPVRVDSEVSSRNNPYPYGPMFLPGYSDASSSSTGMRTRRPVDVTTTIQPPGEEYEYEYEAYDYKEGGRKVLTEKPPVLFHFDGPGYVPEAPSTSAPAVRSPTPSDPWDCSPRCPNYTLEDWNTFYDVRRYPEMTWLSTIIINKDRVLAELEGYMRLQDYFFGLNDRGQVLNLSVPFITQIKHSRHPGVLTEVDDFTISLHVPAGSVGDYELPTPISNEVLVDTLEPKTIFVASFEVDVWDVTTEFLERKAESLMGRLRSNGEAFIDRYYYLASYSRPELYQPVYYEIWIYATSFRNPHVPPMEPLPRPRMPPLSKVTHETMQRLCRGVECPSFEVVRTYKYGIQKRRYFDVVFASVSPGDCYFSTLSVWKGFMPLHLYKHGINSHMEVVEATRPIAVVRVKEDSTPDTECPQNLTMSLFLPRRLHAAPPVTGYTAPGPVVITALEDVMVYAYTVGGYLIDPYRVRKELSDLRYRLTEFGACYREDVYYVVVYDFISRYHGRQNEIWVVAENCKATHNG
ncbi:SOUL hem-binding protein [Trinorchestia longiramus]|nr:SOUL hem-binding protein [Trinorchestia longiramus]